MGEAKRRKKEENRKLALLRNADSVEKIRQAAIEIFDKSIIYDCAWFRFINQHNDIPESISVPDSWKYCGLGHTFWFLRQDFEQRENFKRQLGISKIEQSNISLFNKALKALSIAAVHVDEEDLEFYIDQHAINTQKPC